jgi:hypothetical protein
MIFLIFINTHLQLDGISPSRIPNCNFEDGLDAVAEETPPPTSFQLAHEVRMITKMMYSPTSRVLIARNTLEQNTETFNFQTEHSHKPAEEISFIT